jgi:hypothetical protein
MGEHYSVYVLHLHPESGSTKKMKRQNSLDDDFKGFLYVGMTGLSVEERINNHVSGYKSCNLVKRFYTGEVFVDYPEHGRKFDWRTAVEKEFEVADSLRKKGYCTYQN